MASPTFTINGVPCSAYMEDELVESYSDEGPRATVTFQCAWSQRQLLVQGLLGTVGLSGGSIVRNLPYAYPYDQGADNPRRCLDIPEIRGVKPRADVGNNSGGTGWPTYQYARVKAVFGIPAWQCVAGNPGGQNDPSGLPYTVTKIKTSSEVFSPPGGSFYYKTGSNAGKPVEESTVGIVRPRVEIVMTRMSLPNLPLSNILFLSDGVVNQSEVTIGDYTFPEGCLLFLSANTEPRLEKATGNLLQDVEFNFLGNTEIDWNMFMDRTGEYVLINDKSDGSGNPPFGYDDFSPLFSDDLSYAF